MTNLRSGIERITKALNLEKIDGVIRRWQLLRFTV